jgi:hypothetical protein
MYLKNVLCRDLVELTDVLGIITDVTQNGCSFTSLESIAIVNTCCEHDDNLVKTFMTLYNFGVLIKLNGQHYEIGLPYKPKRKYFPESRSVVFHRMSTTKRCLNT